MSWQVREAKARFSELVDRALKEGPQTVTSHGKPVAVLIAADEYRHLSQSARSFKEFLRRAPLDGVKIMRSRERVLFVKL